MRRNDESEMPAVAEAAQAWRSAMVEPLKQRAIGTGLLPEDVKVDTADSYFTRVWNTLRIEANEGEFRQIVRQYYVGMLDEAIEAEAERRGRRVAKVTCREREGGTPRAIIAAKRGPSHLGRFTFQMSWLRSSWMTMSNSLAGDTRVMSADIELTERFGSPDMKEAVDKIRREYAKLKEAVGAREDLRLR